MAENYDMAVLGGGPGGYVAALRGRQLGLSVLLVEKEQLGGTCLNRGCIPTKALLSDAEGLQWAIRGAREGLLDRKPAINFNVIMKRKADVVSKLVSNLEKLLTGAGVTIINGSAKILEPGILVTDTGKIVRSANIVVATGSRSWIPPIIGGDLPGVLTTRQILELEKVPGKLVIIGGGVIGQEFAAIFSSLGSQVTILEALDRILNEVDQEIARRYSSLLSSRGITTEVGVQVKGIERSKTGLKVPYEKGSKEKVATADLILIATGRRPNLEGSGILELGVRLNNGGIEVDQFLQTSVNGVYAVGDVLGRKMLAHVASYHGEIVAENISGHNRPCEDEVVPGCIFTTPQMAWAGLTEEQAKESGRPFRTSSFSLSSSGKAQAVGETRGLIKLIEDTVTGRLIGAHFMGPHVSELIGEATLAIRRGLSASDIADTIHPHPTLSEAMREAALGLLDGPIHAASRRKIFTG